MINSLSYATDRAWLLSVKSPHSNDWLHALPLSGCGLRLDDRAIHIAVCLRLGANIYEPHQCPCGAPFDARGLHGLSCRGGQRSLRKATQPERPGVASDGEGGHSGVEGAVRPA